jgi:spore coat protein U-like protein
MKTLLSRAALAAAAMAVGLSGALATTATANLNVSLQVTSSCTVSATPLNFGSSTLLSNVDTTATISVTCGSGTGYSVTLGDGQHSVGSSGSGLRMMASSSGTIEYQLYSDSSRGTARRRRAWNGNRHCAAHHRLRTRACLTWRRPRCL